MQPEPDELQPLHGFIEESVRRILARENPDHYFAWLRRAYPTFSLRPKGEAPCRETERALAMQMGRALWNATPLPGNGMRPKPLPKLGRNDPCPCGSDQKYKRCCSRWLPKEELELSPDLIMAVVARLLPAEQIEALSDSAPNPASNSVIPIDITVERALQHYQAGHRGKATRALEPILAEPPDRVLPAHLLAFDVLYSCYDDMGHGRKKRRLLDRFSEGVPRSPLRSVARLRLAEHHWQDGEHDEAMATLQQAKQDDPSQPGLGLLEVAVLTDMGEFARARQRCRFWIEQLRGSGDTQELRHLAKMLTELDSATDRLHRQDGPLERLATWFEAAQDRAIPTYRVTDGEVGSSLAERFRQMGIPADQIQDTIQKLEASRGKAGVEPGPEHGSPESEDPDPRGELTPDPEIREVEAAWRDVFPDGKPFSTADTLGEPARAWEPEEAEAWLDLLERHPAAADSLDILDDLVTALLAMRMNPEHEEDGTIQEQSGTLLLGLLERAHDIVRAAAETSEAGLVLLPWSRTINRPGLRAVVRLSMAYEAMDQPGEANALAGFLLHLNPDDNHGMRCLVMNTLLRANQDEEALTLADRYPDDQMCDMAFGRILALYRGGRLDQARKELGRALSYQPFVPEYLVRARVRKPELPEFGITMGSPDEAWLYRKEMRAEWKATKGALVWLTEAAADASNL